MPRILFLSLLLLPLAIMAQKVRKVMPGDKLPELVLSPVYANAGLGKDTIRTGDLIGKKILLTFNRYVSCPLCNFRTHQLLAKYDSLKQCGLVIISVYESAKDTLKQYTAKEEIPFIMIADPDEKLYRQFKVQKSWLKSFFGLFRGYRKSHSRGVKLFKSRYKRDGSLNRIGADFLIDESGTIRVAYYGKYVGDHLPVEAIMAWLRSKK